MSDLKDINSTIGNTIYKIRIEKNLSRNYIASILGITHQQLHKYEKGANKISASKLLLLVRTLDVPINYFYNDSEFNGIISDVSEVEKKSSITMIKNFLRLSKAHQDMINCLIKEMLK